MGIPEEAEHRFRDLEHGFREVEHKGRITKSGNNRTRWLLVEAAWVLLTRVKKPRVQPLHARAQRIAARRGKRVAVVALARRLAGILYAIMRDGTELDARRFVTAADHASVTT